MNIQMIQHFLIVWSANFAQLWIVQNKQKKKLLQQEKLFFFLFILQNLTSFYDNYNTE